MRALELKKWLESDLLVWKGIQTLPVVTNEDKKINRIKADWIDLTSIHMNIR